MSCVTERQGRGGIRVVLGGDGPGCVPLTPSAGIRILVCCSLALEPFKL